MESSFIDAARKWVTDCYPYNRHHLLKALEWLDNLEQWARESQSKLELAILRDRGAKKAGRTK